MSTFSSLYLIALASGILLYIIPKILSQREGLVSLRNFFIAGLIIFQITGPAASLISGDVASFQPSDVDGTSVKFSLMITVFVLIFLCTYQGTTRFVDAVFSRRPERRETYSPLGLMVIAISMIGFGVLSQYVLVYLPVLGPGFQRIAYGLYAIGAGLATWSAAPRLMNPFYLFTSLGVILVALVLTFAQNFGRRDLLGVILAVLWALYFSHWKHLPFTKLVIRFGTISFCGVILLGLVTSARSGVFREQSAMQNISSLKGASAGKGVRAIFYGQQAGLNSMWLIESRPESHAYDTLHSVKLVLAFPIPRSMWVNKPDALGYTMPKTEIKISKKAKGWNIGPGIIGHIANDNPYIALWLYPIILGAILRFFDRAVVWFSDNPFIVLPVGGAIGQVVAMPRGELGTFFFLAMLNIISAYVLMKVISWVLKVIGWIQVEHGEWGDDADWDYDSYPSSDYAEEYV